jgi:hypothetical protein
MTPRARGRDSAPRDRSLSTFYVTLAAALLFTFYTSASLPEVVASHFNSAGIATGFLPRRIYTAIALLMVLLPPILLVFVPRRRLRSPTARINLPNSAYWLAPERRDETIAMIARSCTGLGVLLMIFMCFVHWLVVLANHSVPPTLSSGWFLGGLVVFLGLMVRGAGGLVGRFRSAGE